jgi:hypothetical protein
MMAIVAHDRLNEYLELVRGEFEALQAECMVVKGQRDEFEKQSTFFCSSPFSWYTLSLSVLSVTPSFHASSVLPLSAAPFQSILFSILAA